jgi:predicted esterase
MRGLSNSKTLSARCADGRSRQYTWHLPSRYSPKRPTGLLVFLHGAVSQPAPGGGAHESERIGSAVDSLGFIKLGPSTYDRHDWGETAVRAHVHQAIDEVKRRFNVDENRVYIAGDSDGGRGAFALVETEATFLAASVPTIGAPGSVTRYVNLRPLPFLVINGAKDTLFPIDRVRESVERMKAADISIDFRVIEDAGHDAFLFKKMEEDVCAFLEKHVRDPLPKKVDWQVDPAKEADFPANTFRWIRIDEVGDTASKGTFDDFGGIISNAFGRIRATKEDGNRVLVDTHRVKRLTVLVSDEMFDLEKEVEIVVNGKPVFREVVATDAKVVLEEARRFNDRRLVFNNRITLEVK